ncbi:small-conductance mechanosensitive channel [Paramagnetospirillum kuznetsovii]|uniref:Small-conductance mechanosensitive channel n=1 Tax=Paramagnetospirillum kuznetsovii TaxID=2053833 RepID=A0A364NXY7_9PROT|nr:mechanosensitive ion channel domain-containing protein [Paramagnetospirillum kuznetsovii]RAU21777.1 small-conductance mechanosensitive channel [Paramagnetospirillum kuznetsovii]
MTLLSTYSPLRRVLASLILAVLLCAPAMAAEPVPPPAPDELGRLVATLEDAKSRDALVAQLKALLAAQQAAKPTVEVTLLAHLSDKAGDLRVELMTLAIIAAAVAAAKLLHRVVDRALASGRPESRANTYLPLLHRVLRGLIGVAGLLALAELWGFHPMSLLDSDLGRQVATTLVHLAVVLVMALVAWHLLHGAIERYLTATDAEGNPLQRSGRARTLLPLARNAVFVLLVVMVVLIVLSELGVDIAPLLAGAGVLGIAIGFGSQKLVQDIITGVFILFEDTIAVGDSVKLGEHSGTVEAISIRAIRLRDGNGGLHTVPFSAVTTVVNATKGFNTAVIDIGVAYDQDMDRILAIMAELGAELQADAKWGSFMAAPLEVLGLERFDPSAMVIRAQVRTTPGDRAALIREFNRRIKARFDAEGIAMPLPQMQVRMAGSAAK